MRGLKHTAAACALALGATFLLAAPTTAQPNAIVVEAPRASDEAGVRHYVSAINIPGAAAPKWTTSLCTGVVGIEGRAARALNDRIASVAHRYDVATGDPGCQPNAIIYFTNDPDGVAARLGGLDGAAQRPVRWRHLTSTMADGFQVENDSQSVIQSSMPVTSSVTSTVPVVSSLSGGDQNVTNGVRARDASRVRGNTSAEISRVAIVVDTRALQGVHFAQLADMITMLTLAQVNPNADLSGAPSVLNMFDPSARNAPTRMTGWDYAYLNALYDTREDVRDAEQQERLLVRAMLQGN